MRLIKIPAHQEAFSIVFAEISNVSARPYGILSHTWNVEKEVTYADVERHSYEHKEGWQKIKSVMHKARADGLSYVWVDTCCIDKSSSAELSESINSMYKWYQEASECYVFLEDIADRIDHTTELEFLTRTGTQARWFTRGWTLQELLAPSSVSFYDYMWRKLGTKHSLAATLSRVTGIPETCITGLVDPRSASISARMSWAANRTTTREEDLAYCLIGLFDINMPLLYGEGDKAFIRLQEEIMKGSDDQTLFAWAQEPALHLGSTNGGLLASSPKAFKDSSYFLPTGELQQRPPYQMTNRGLQIQLPMSQYHDDNTGMTYYKAELECHPRAAIILQKTRAGAEQYARYDCSRLDFGDDESHDAGSIQEIYVRQNPAYVREMRSRYIVLTIKLQNQTDTPVAAVASKLHSAFYHGATILHAALQHRLEKEHKSRISYHGCRMEIECKPGPAVSLLFDVNKTRDTGAYFSRTSHFPELTIGIADDGNSLVFMARHIHRQAEFCRFKEFLGTPLASLDHLPRSRLSKFHCDDFDVEVKSNLDRKEFDCTICFHESQAAPKEKDHTGAYRRWQAKEGQVFDMYRHIQMPQQHVSDEDYRHWHIEEPSDPHWEGFAYSGDGVYD